MAKLIWGTGHLSRASGYAARPTAEWVASFLGPAGLAPAQFPGRALASLLAGLAKLRTTPGRAWMAAAVARTAEEMPGLDAMVRGLGRCSRPAAAQGCGMWVSVSYGVEAGYNTACFMHQTPLLSPPQPTNRQSFQVSVCSLAALRAAHSAAASPQWCAALLAGLPRALPDLGARGTRQLLVAVCSLQLPPETAARAAAAMGPSVEAAAAAAVEAGRPERAQEMRQRLAVLRGDETRAPHVSAGLARELLLQRQEHLQRQLEAWERAKGGSGNGNGNGKGTNGKGGGNGKQLKASRQQQQAVPASAELLATAAVGGSGQES